MNTLLLVFGLLASAGCRRPADAAATLDTTNACTTTRECLEFGMCTPSEGVCVAASDADCRRGQSCARFGYCAARVGRCVAAAAPTCEALGSEKIDPCHGQRPCEPHDGICAPVMADDAACRTPAPGRTTSACAYEGLCTARDGFCVATRDEDCRASTFCQNTGQCVARGGLCVAETQESCRSAPECTTLGRCTRGASFCYATDADCAALPQCREQGKGCTAEGGDCSSPPFIYFQF